MPSILRQSIQQISLLNLDKIGERKRLDGSNNTIFTGLLQEVSSLGKLGSPLKVHLNSGLTGFILGGFIGNLTGQNLPLALGFANVLNADMNSLFKDASIDELVYTHTNGRFGHIEDNSSATVVVLVRHTLVDGGIGKDINVVTYFDGHHVLTEGGKTMLTVLLGKHVPGAGADSE
jgi:hypothetical protein